MNYIDDDWRPGPPRFPRLRAFLDDVSSVGWLIYWRLRDRLRGRP